MHDGDAVVAIDRLAETVVAGDDALGVDRASTGGATALIGMSRPVG